MKLKKEVKNYDGQTMQLHEHRKRKDAMCGCFNRWRITFDYDLTTKGAWIPPCIYF